MFMGEGYLQSVLAMQRAALENSFKWMGMMHETTCLSIQRGLSLFPWIPEQGKQMIAQMFDGMQAGREMWKGMVCGNYDQLTENLGRNVAEASSRITETTEKMATGYREMSREAATAVRQAMEEAGQVTRGYYGEGARGSKPAEAKAARPSAGKRATVR